MRKEGKSFSSRGKSGWFVCPTNSGIQGWVLQRAFIHDAGSQAGATANLAMTI
jgi:hypothetical protein